jgi:hypothetical protein
MLMLLRTVPKGKTDIIKVMGNTKWSTAAEPILPPVSR